MSSSHGTAASSERNDITGIDTAVGEIWTEFRSVLDSLLAADAMAASEPFRALLTQLEDHFCQQSWFRGDGRIRPAVATGMKDGLMARLSDFAATDQARDEKVAADWLMSVMELYQEICRFAVAIETVTEDGDASHDERRVSFAGNSSFIPISEVLQMLGGSRHRGLLVLSASSNTLDIYFDESSIALMSPHHLVRSVFAGDGMHALRTIPEDALVRAEKRQVDQSLPIFLSLTDEGVLKPEESREIGYLLASEVLFELLHRADEEVRFSYYQLRELPDFVSDQNLRMPVTPMLLEANKCLDDWNSMLKIFPHADQPIVPVDDLFAQIGSMTLDVHELRLLSAVGANTTPNDLIPIVGLPLPEIYRSLIRFAREGIIAPQCPQEEFAELLLLGLMDDVVPETPKPAAPEENSDIFSAVHQAFDLLED